MNINFAALLIGGALIATTPVAARTVTAPNGVRYADLDLSTPSGRTKLDRRVALALESACGSYANASAEEQNEITRCRRDASARLAPQLARILDAHAPVQSAMLDR